MKWKPAPVFLPGEFHGQRNPAGYSPWSCKKSDTEKHLSTHSHTSRCLLWCLTDKESTCQCRRPRFNSWVRKTPPRGRKWPPTLVCLSRESCGQGSLVDYSPWSHKRVRQGLGTKQQKTLLSTLCTFSMFKSHCDLLHLLLLWILILQMQKLRHRIFK